MTWADDRLAAAKAQVEAYEAAILALTVGGVSEYQLSTGQSVQRVKKQDLSMLQSGLKQALQQYSMWDQAVNGGGITYAR